MDLHIERIPWDPYFWQSAMRTSISQLSSQSWHSYNSTKEEYGSHHLGSRIQKPGGNKLNLYFTYHYYHCVQLCAVITNAPTKLSFVYVCMPWHLYRYPFSTCFSWHLYIYQFFLHVCLDICTCTYKYVYSVKLEHLCISTHLALTLLHFGHWIGLAYTCIVDTFFT